MKHYIQIIDEAHYSAKCKITSDNITQLKDLNILTVTVNPVESLVDDIMTSTLFCQH